MTSRFIKKMSEPYEIEVCIEITCDLCNKRAPNPQKQSQYSRSSAWTTDKFEVNQILVSHEEGSSYPEGSFTKTERFDVCPDCWETKLMPWFHSQGATVTIAENDS
jgi:hypothetical protein